jgi:L-cystine uptake protein TcyP (sodium:dicarboxylate symporter family)
MRDIYYHHICADQSVYKPFHLPEAIFTFIFRNIAGSFPYNTSFFVGDLTVELTVFAISSMFAAGFTIPVTSELFPSLLSYPAAQMIGIFQVGVTVGKAERSFV